MAYTDNSMDEGCKWAGIAILMLVLALFVGAGMGWIN
jgi:hypothetical protein